MATRIRRIGRGILLGGVVGAVVVVGVPTSAQALNECGDAKVYVVNGSAGPYGNVGGASAACDRVTIQTWASYPAYPGYEIHTRDMKNPYQYGYYSAAVHLYATTMTQWHASSRDNADDPIAYGNWRAPVYTPTVF